MISRETYEALGGHTSIAGDLLEDVAMARLVKSSGRKIFFRYGGDAVRTRMYRSWAQMKEGWTKNLALLFRHPVAMALGYLVESYLLLSVVTGLIQTAVFGPAQILSQSVLLPHYPIPEQYAALFRWWLTGGLVAICAYLVLRSIRRLRNAHFPVRFLGFSLLGPSVFAYLLLSTVMAHRRSAVRWKGRTYQAQRV